jgi:hypothetical protein
MPEASPTSTNDGQAGDGPAERPAAARSKPLAPTFGTAVGAAMLGLEQALRREPPAQVVAAEHVPERAQIGVGGGLIIEIPEPPERR